MTTLSNAQKAELENQGYTVAKGLLPLDVCRRCCEMVDVFLGGGEPVAQVKWGGVAGVGAGSGSGQSVESPGSNADCAGRFRRRSWA